MNRYEVVDNADFIEEEDQWQLDFFVFEAVFEFGYEGTDLRWKEVEGRGERDVQMGDRLMLDVVVFEYFGDDTDAESVLKLIGCR